MTRAELIENLRTLVKVADRYRNYTYMKPPATAEGKMEEERLGTIPYFEWEEGGRKFTARYKVDCTSRHIYAWGVYTRDGKVTNLHAIKNSLKRLEQEESENV